MGTACYCRDDRRLISQSTGWSKAEQRHHTLRHRSVEYRGNIDISLMFGWRLSEWHTLCHHQHHLPDNFSFSLPGERQHKSSGRPVADKEVGLEIRRSSDMNLNTLVLCVRSLRCLRSPARSQVAPYCSYQSRHIHTEWIFLTLLKSHLQT